MRMAVALSVRQIHKDRADRHPRRFESVLLAAATHEKISRPMLRFIRLLMLLLVHRDPPSILRPIPVPFLGNLPQYLGAFLPASLQLLNFTHENIAFQMPGKSRKITHSNFARVKQVMG